LKKILPERWRFFFKKTTEARPLLPVSEVANFAYSFFRANITALKNEFQEFKEKGNCQNGNLKK
jgi:hypothetical protein